MVACDTLCALVRPVQLIDEALSLPHTIPVTGELVIGQYGIVGD